MFWRAEPFAGFWIDADRFYEANPTCFVSEFVAAGFEVFCDAGREIGFEEDGVG